MSDTSKDNITIEDLFNAIKEQNGIMSIWLKVINMIKDMTDFEEDNKFLMLLCLYFSLLDDGNTCICLDKTTLFNKWIQKWTGLLLVSEKESILTPSFFDQVITEGINQILSNKADSIIHKLEDKEYTNEEILQVNKLFVLKPIKGKYWLFATKYFAAKLSIEQRIAVLFNSDKIIVDEKKQMDEIIQFFKDNTQTGNPIRPYIELNPEQAQAIVEGKYKNLIITGGPGTGKTTAVCYLLWKLMEKEDGKPDYLSYNLYLAAPSGKAAERMKESISGSLNLFKQNIIDCNPEIMQKLTETDSSTIHRLLSYNPGTNGFNYNKEHQFEEKSIFIIDEASMIDIALFRSLLEAIPDNARVFILGDKDQLPSVQAGAVLGELLGKKTDSVVSLITSNRFNSESEVGRFKDEMLQDNILNELGDKGKAVNSTDDFVFVREESGIKVSMDKNPVFLYSLKDMDKEKNIPGKKEQIKAIAQKWSNVFCQDLTQKALFENKSKLDCKELNHLWSLANEAKILCAERQGLRGVETLNKIIKDYVCKNTKTKEDEEGYYVGQLLILTQNQKMFRLYNGDTGIVVGFNNANHKYLMVQKKAGKDDEDTDLSNNNDENVDIFRKGDFLFYPLYLLPKESIEPSYAITIHKSQGSGYKNILVFLPEQKGHPLLNRQIVYTAVTRTEGNTYIVATMDAVNYAKSTVICRDTMIEL